MDYKAYLIRGDFSKNKAIFLDLFDKFTGFFIKSRPVKVEPKKILIVRNDHIGDIILCNQIFREVKKKFPNSHVTALVSNAAKPIIEKDPNIDEILVFDLFWRKKTISSFLEYLKFLKKLKQKKFDVGIDVRASLLSIFFFLWLPKIKKRVGYYNISGGKAFLTHPVFFEKKDHTVKFDLNVVEKGLEFKADDYWPKIFTDKKDKQEVDLFIKKNKLKKFICICPNARYELKTWKLEKFDEIIKHINKKYPDYKVILVGANEDEEKIDYLKKQNKNCLKLINFNLRALSILFKKSKFVMAMDSGPMHLAWVSDAKLIALLGPIDLTTMQPLKNSIIIHHKLECFPCQAIKCKKPKGKRCIDLISVEEVKNVVDEILK